MALYTGAPREQSGTTVTTSILSKKRAKKIERNARYIAQRKAQLEASRAAESGMEMDVQTIAKREKEVKPETNLDKVKKVLYRAIEEAAKEKSLGVAGEGTTLGVQAF